MVSKASRAFKEAVAKQCIEIEGLWDLVYKLGKNPKVTVVVRDPENDNLFIIVTNEGKDLSKVVERMQNPQWWDMG